jgi:hypothetical protein
VFERFIYFFGGPLANARVFFIMTFRAQMGEKKKFDKTGFHTLQSTLFHRTKLTHSSSLKSLQLNGHSSYRATNNQSLVAFGYQLMEAEG